MSYAHHALARQFIMPYSEVLIRVHPLRNALVYCHPLEIHRNHKRSLSRGTDVDNCVKVPSSGHSIAKRAGVVMSFVLGPWNGIGYKLERARAVPPLPFGTLSDPQLLSRWTGISFLKTT